MAANGALGSRILGLADVLAEYSDTAEGLSCTYMTLAHRSVAATLRKLMSAAGMAVHTDAVGNVVGRLESASPGAKTVIAGSHYDTVRDAGKYDGRLGILLALVAIEELQRNGVKLPFHLELVAFSEEEGVRFSTPYIGSSAVAGRFDMSVLKLRDAAGYFMADVLQESGFDPADIPKIARRPQDLLAYLEVHMEQGPALIAENLPVGIVTAIAGAARWQVEIEGAAGHAGTVPIALRHDAAAAAAEIVLYVERRCSQGPAMVGTVGKLEVPRGAINVIPARCELSIDVRAADDAALDSAKADIKAEIERIAQRRGVTIDIRELSSTRPVICSPKLQDVFATAIERAGITPYRLMSGAGHDAVMFGGLTEVGMLFVRCGNDGISHSPLESVSAEDADIAARVFYDAILRLGQ